VKYRVARGISALRRRRRVFISTQRRRISQRARRETPLSTPPAPIALYCQHRARSRAAARSRQTSQTYSVTRSKPQRSQLTQWHIALPSVKQSSLISSAEGRRSWPALRTWHSCFAPASGNHSQLYHLSISGRRRRGGGGGGGGGGACLRPPALLLHLNLAGAALTRLRTALRLPLHEGETLSIGCLLPHPCAALPGIAPLLWF